MATKPLHIEHASREDLLQVPGIGVERVKVIVAHRKAFGGTMTESEFLELGFPSRCTGKILDESYIQFSELRVRISQICYRYKLAPIFNIKKDAVDIVSHEKSEFDISDAKSILLQSDVETDTKPTELHNEKPVRASDELVRVSTLLVYESYY